MSPLIQCFSTQIPPRPVSSKNYNFWDGVQQTEKNSPLKSILSLFSTPSPFNKRDLETFLGHMLTKKDLLTNFVSVAHRKMFFCIF